MDDAQKQELAEERTEWAEERTEWAEERTEWADQRTYLAQQRTFAGWLRTGLTSLAVGLGILELLRMEPEWVITTMAAIFIVAGGLIPVLAFIGYRKVELHMRESRPPKSSLGLFWIGFLAAAITLAAMGAMVLVFASV